MDSREAYIVMNLLPRVGPVRARQLIAACGSPEGVLQADRARLIALDGVGPAIAEAIADWRRLADLDRELADCREAGVQILTPADDAFPAVLDGLRDGPLALYVRGELDALRPTPDQALAVVGSRRMTLYGEKAVGTLVEPAARAGWVIVSGLARGIDTEAHRATLRADGCTIAVIAGGLNHVTPRENHRLAADICRCGGALVSEQPLNAAPDKRAFPMRNRLIAALAQGTLVVEAGPASGSLITARRARDYGRPVFAVPGRIDAPGSRGCNELIADGANLVQRLDDLLSALTFLPGFSCPPPPQTERVTVGADSEPPALGLSDVERTVCEQLAAGEAAIDELSRYCDQPVHELLTVMLGLEMKCVVQRCPGGRYALRK